MIGLRLSLHLYSSGQLTYGQLGEQDLTSTERKNWVSDKLSSSHELEQPPHVINKFNRRAKLIIMKRLKKKYSPACIHTAETWRGPPPCQPSNRLCNAVNEQPKPQSKSNKYLTPLSIIFIITVPLWSLIIGDRLI